MLRLSRQCFQWPFRPVFPISSNSSESIVRMAGAGLLPALHASALFNFPFTLMFNHFKHLICGTAALLGAITFSEGQTSPSTTVPKSLAAGTLQAVPSVDSQAKPATSPTAPSAKTGDNSPITLVQASTTNAAPSPANATKSSATATTTSQTPKAHSSRLGLLRIVRLDIDDSRGRL